MSEGARGELSRPDRSRAARLATYALALGLAIAAYLPGLPGEFVYDDHRLIVENEGLRRPLDLRRAFLRDYYASDADRMGLGYYRPVAILSNELDYRRGGGASLPFHLTNIALHMACSALVVALARRCVGGWIAPAVAGALFALHPAHAESVAFISGRVDPLATLFGLAAILLYLKGAASARPTRWRIGAACAWLAALLSKEIAITVPVLAVCAEVGSGSFAWMRTWREWAKRVVPFGTALILYLLLRRIALGAWLGGAVTGGSVGRILQIPAVLGSYLAWLVLPPLGIHLEPAVPEGIWKVAALAVFAAALCTAVVLARRGRLLELALLAWCVVALLPVAQIRPLETELSERFLYLPSVGACVLAGSLAHRESGKRARAGAIAGACAVAALYAAILVPRSLAWRDSVTLWSAKAREEPSSLKAQLNLGRALAQRGDVAGSRAAYERAAMLHPEMADTARAEFESLTAGRAGVSEETIRRALESTPGDAALWSNLGFALVQKNDLTGASDAFQRAVALVPGRSNAWLGLAITELRRGNLDAAVEAARRCIELNPRADLARMVLAECALRRGRPCETIQQLEGTSFDAPEELAARDKLLQLARPGCVAGPSAFR